MLDRSPKDELKMYSITRDINPSEKRPISKELVIKTRSWLGNEGIAFFKDIKEKFNEINTCWDEGGIPHSVHFREGMQVRNFMRNSGLCVGWSDHDFDNNWIPLIEEIIK